MPTTAKTAAEPTPLVIPLPDGGELLVPADLVANPDIDTNNLIGRLLEASLRPAPKLTVHQAIAAVVAELEGVGKDQTGPAQQGGYKYRGIEDVTGALQKLCGKHGVVIWPVAKQGPTDDAVGMTAGWSDYTVTVTWGVAGPAGDLLTPAPETIGIGRDNSDKGVNKAMTQAYKYLLLQLFMVADPKDDTDAHGSYDGGRQTEADQGPRLLPRETFLELAAAIKAMPEVGRAHLMAAWAAEDPIEGGSFLPLDGDKPALRFVKAEHEQAVRALIAAGLRAAKEAGEAPQEPQEASDGDPAPDTADDADTAAEGADEATDS